MAGLQSGEGRVMIDSVVCERQPRRHSKCRANALASCGKNLRHVLRLDEIKVTEHSSWTKPSRDQCQGDLGQQLWQRNAKTISAIYSYE